jgi:hypothetical protein
MEHVKNGDAFLGGVNLVSMGCDTVVVRDPTDNTIYISAHLKDYKKGDTKSPNLKGQLSGILTIVENNPGTKIILMMDANTQFEIREGSHLRAFSKEDASDSGEIVTERPVVIRGKISDVSTSNKMRACHTAQLQKSFKPIKAVIDHVFSFNHEMNEAYRTTAYVLNADGMLVEKDDMTPTTSAKSIPDHAFVISTFADGNSYGTLNIKDGNKEDQTWAEFLPAQYLPFFEAESVKAKLDELLLASFRGLIDSKDKALDSPEKIKAKDVLSTPRFGVFNIHLPNELAPMITITSDGTITGTTVGGESFHLEKEGDVYRITSPISGLEAFLATLVEDLNNSENAYEKRSFFIKRGHGLLNYWHTIQNDRTFLEGTTLNAIYAKWHHDASEKVEIAEILRQAKERVPSLKIVGIQEIPKNDELKEDIVSSIRSLGYRVFCGDMMPGKCETRGAIVVFPDALVPAIANRAASALAISANGSASATTVVATPTHMNGKSSSLCWHTGATGGKRRKTKRRTLRKRRTTRRNHKHRH